DAEPRGSGARRPGAPGEAADVRVRLRTGLLAAYPAAPGARRAGRFRSLLRRRAGGSGPLPAGVRTPDACAPVAALGTAPVPVAGARRAARRARVADH